MAGISRGADRTFRTATRARSPPAVKSTAYRGLQSRTVTLVTQVDANKQPTTLRFEYGRTHATTARTPTAIDAGSGDAYAPVTVPLSGLRPNTRYHFRAVATNAAATPAASTARSSPGASRPAISVTLAPEQGRLGRRPDPHRARPRHRRGRHAASRCSARASRSRAASPTSRARPRASSGTFQFNVNSLFETTHLRVVTDTLPPVSSAVYTASSAVKVGAERSRSQGRLQASVTGAIWPSVPNGRVSLQKRSPRGRWAVVKRADGAAARRQPLALQLHREACDAREACEPVPRRRAGARRRCARARALGRCA